MQVETFSLRSRRDSRMVAIRRAVARSADDADADEGSAGDAGTDDGGTGDDGGTPGAVVVAESGGAAVVGDCSPPGTWLWWVDSWQLLSLAHYLC